MPSQTPAAFISYSRDDSDFALRLAQDLKAAGAAVWIDQLDIPAGTNWDNAIEDALIASPRMLLILSPGSSRSNNVRNEISFALEQGKTVIPVLYQDCTVPLQLQRANRIDFRADYAHGLASLLSNLQVAHPNHTVLDQAAEAEAQRKAAWQAREAEAKRLQQLEAQREQAQREQLVPINPPQPRPTPPPRVPTPPDIRPNRSSRTGGLLAAIGVLVVIIIAGIALFRPKPSSTAAPITTPPSEQLPPAAPPPRPKAAAPAVSQQKSAAPSPAVPKPGTASGTPLPAASSPSIYDPTAPSNTDPFADADNMIRGKPASPSSNSLAGTTWAYTDTTYNNLYPSESMQFLSDGTVRETYFLNRFTTIDATWQQSGDSFTIQLTNGTTQYRGRIAGSKMTGTYTHPKTGQSGTWAATRQ